MLSQNKLERSTYWYPVTSSRPNSIACSHCPISMLLSNAKSSTFTCRRSNGWNKPSCFFKQTLHVSRSEEELRQLKNSHYCKNVKCRKENLMHATCFEKLIHSIHHQFSNDITTYLDFTEHLKQIHCFLNPDTFHYRYDTLCYRTLAPP
jgi:hypothetical protein